jgi:hypothetical protein
MKKYFLTVLLFAFLFIIGCKKDSVDEALEYYSSIGMISITTDSAIITTDTDKRLLITNRNMIASVNNNDRVIVFFNKLDQTIPKGITYVIQVSSIEKVLVKPVFELTTKTLDSIGNNALFVNSLWIAKKYLNLDYSYYGGQLPHLINLTRTQGTLRTDTIDLEIKHNQNGDTGTTWLYNFVSFDLSSLQNNVTDSVVLRIKAKEYDNRTYQTILYYKF